jgi:hypothetical protein
VSKVVIVANLRPRKLKGIESTASPCWPGSTKTSRWGRASSEESRDRRQSAAAQAERDRIDRQPVLAGFHPDIPVGARLK